MSANSRYCIHYKMTQGKCAHCRSEIVLPEGWTLEKTIWVGSSWAVIEGL